VQKEKEFMPKKKGMEWKTQMAVNLPHSRSDIFTFEGIRTDT
jgi:hypothetical protein